MELAMINHISYTALGIALLAGASAANAQTLIADQPGAVIVREQPARTVETVARCARSNRLEP